MTAIDWKAYENMSREERDNLINDLESRGYLCGGIFNRQAKLKRFDSQDKFLKVPSGKRVSPTDIELGLEKLTFGNIHQIQLINASTLLSAIGYI